MAILSLLGKIPEVNIWFVIKVKDLIKILKTHDQNLDVFINWDGDGPAEICEVVLETDQSENYPDDWNMPDKWVEIDG